MVMNLLAADLGSPRSVAVYVLPPVLYAACSDRLIAVAGRLGGVRETGHVARGRRGRAVRVAAGARAAITALGLRRWVLAATPLPAAPAAQEEKPAKLCQVQTACRLCPRSRHAGSR